MRIPGHMHARHEANEAARRVLTPRRDLENATKAAQSAALLVADLKDLVRTNNLLLSDAALAELELAAALHVRLQRLQSNLETMEATS